MRKPYRVGEIVVYTKQKTGTSPGPRAKHVHGAKKGDDYTYLVDKFWRVVSSEGNQLVLRTRRGKSHEVSADDSRLRRPTFWENLFLRSKFPVSEDNVAETDRDSMQSTSTAK